MIYYDLFEKDFNKRWIDRIYWPTLFEEDDNNEREMSRLNIRH